jgi:hypothetical protein
VTGKTVEKLVPQHKGSRFAYKTLDGRNHADLQIFDLLFRQRIQHTVSGSQVFIDLVPVGRIAKGTGDYVGKEIAIYDSDYTSHGA